jgi:hypothetical protein
MLQPGGFQPFPTAGQFHQPLLTRGPQGFNEKNLLTFHGSLLKTLLIYYYKQVYILLNIFFNKISH